METIYHKLDLDIVLRAKNYQETLSSPMGSSFPSYTVFPLDVLILTGNSGSDLAEHGVCHCHVLSFLSVVWCVVLVCVCCVLTSPQLSTSGNVSSPGYQCPVYNTTHNTYNQNKAHPYRIGNN